MSQFHADLVYIIHGLLECGKEAVYVFLVGVYAITSLMLRLYIESPSVLVVLNHLDLVKSYFVGPFYCRAHVQGRKHFQGPVVQPCQRDLLLGKILVIRSVAQGSVRIEETHSLDAFPT